MTEPLILTEPIPSSELSVAGMVQFLRRHWKTFLFLPGLAFLLGVLLLHLADSKYTASLVVTPAQTGNGEVSGLGGIAAMAGVNLSGADDQNRFALYRAGLLSREVAAELARDEELLRQIFPRDWSASHNGWAAPESTIGSTVTAVKTVLGFPLRRWEPPGPARMQDFLRRNVTIIEDKDNPIYSIQLEMKNPEIAVAILTRIHEISDSIQKNRAQGRAKSRIDYLSSELQKNSLLERRTAIASLLVEQENNLMMSSSDEPFAAYPFDGLVISTSPTSPRPLLVLALSIAAGIGLALMTALLRDAIFTSTV